MLGVEVISEWLVIEGSDQSRRDATVYKRNKDQIDLGKLTAYQDGKTTIDLLDTLGSLGIKEDELLLNKVLLGTAQSKRGNILNAALSWFIDSLKIIQPEARFAPLISMLDSDAAFREWTAGILGAVDTGIGNFKVEKESINPDNLPTSFSKFLESGPLMRGDGVELSFDEENKSKIVRRSLKSTHVTGEQEFELPFSEESDGN